MKEFTEFFREKKDLIFKNLEIVETKNLGSRKKIDIFSGTSLNSDYIAIFKIDSKSRFLIKNAQELEELFVKLKAYKGHNFKKKYAIINSPLCSKAKTLLEDLKWSVEIDFM